MKNKLKPKPKTKNLGRYQLVLRAKRKADGKWMRIVYDHFKLLPDMSHRLSVEDIVAKNGTNALGQLCHRFGTWDANGYSFANYARLYKGGWWFCDRRPLATANRMCLNCDQRTTHLWMEESKKVEITETQMSIRVEIPLADK